MSGGTSSLVAEASRLAQGLVAPLGRRWLHVQAVAERTAELRRAVDEAEGERLVAAAWLHDIGYSPDIGHTRFHPLDGARHLRDTGWPGVIVDLVAHHSGARYEAEERGLTAELSEFPLPDGPVLDALVMADLTTGPSGERVTYDQRISEILDRYPPGDPVHQAWLFARPVMAECVRRTESRLAAAQPR
ncbi:HD domain-containing protein [Pseudonocardia alni]|uniref:HD domain-containing protein n=1 Tax=Pseudonocardia alni TaxID=33907 RepID=UPI0036C40EE7